MQPTLALVGPTSPTPTQRMDADDLVGLVEEEDKQWANKPQRRVLICWDAANGTSAVTQRIADLQHLTRDAAQPAVGRHLGTVPGGIVRRNRSRVLLTVKPSGRLGNLMFQWAALLGLARRAGSDRWFTPTCPITTFALPKAHSTNSLCVALYVITSFVISLFCKQTPVKEVRPNSFDENILYQVNNARCGDAGEPESLRVRDLIRR